MVSRWEQVLREAMSLPGALGVALVDLETGTCEAAVADSEDKAGLSLVAQVQARMLRAQMRLVQEQRSEDRIEDLMITFDRNYHLIRPIRVEGAVSFTFLCLVMDRSQSNLAMTRRKLADLEDRLAQRMAWEDRSGANRESENRSTGGEHALPPFMRDDHVMRLLGLTPSGREAGPEK